MGVTLDLRVIDHERVVIQGLKITNEAIQKKDPEILRRFLNTFPVEVDKDLVALHKSRIKRLRQMKAPAVIIEIEERSIRDATGETYAPAEVSAASFDRLRELLGTWCWRNNCFALDKAWSELNWFLDPRDATAEPPYFPFPRQPGDPNQSPFDKAINGSQRYPLDIDGQPIIRTLGSKDDGCSGYNPPEESSAIYEALAQVDLQTWPDLVTRYVALQGKLYADVDPDLIDLDEIGDNSLKFAQEVFPVLKRAYAVAAEKGYGVSCESSL